MLIKSAVFLIPYPKVRFNYLALVQLTKKYS